MNIEKNNNKYIPNLDVLRVAATVGVVLIHVSDILIVAMNNININLWYSVNFIEGIVRFSVPIFFMLTGALLLGKKDESPFKFYKYRFPRILIVYVVWSILYTYINANLNSQEVSMDLILQRIFNFDSYYHMWFFKPLLIIYLLIPILRSAIDVMPKTLWIYIIIIWFIFDIFGLFLLNIYRISIFPINIFFVQYIGYCLLGHMIVNMYPNKLKIKSLGIILTVVGMISTSYLIYKTSNLEDNTIVSYFYNPLSINIFLSSVGIFIFINSIKFKNRDYFALRKLSNISFGVFLVHPLILTIVKFDFEIDLVAQSSFSSYTMVSLIVLLSSFAISFVLNKIPVLKRIV